MLAQAFGPRFSDDDSVVVFASGVSNSAETAQHAFDREASLLDASLQRARRLVYFSSCAVANPHQSPTPYFAHKQRMEAMVLAEQQLVFRLPQVVGRSANPKTLTNFLYRCISEGAHFTLHRGVERNLIDVDHVALIAQDILERCPFPMPDPISIATPESLTMRKIVDEFERVLGRRGIYTESNLTAPFPIETSVCLASAARVGISFDETYLPKMLRKYYG